ncbi:ParB/RepB/Spo0J family partition protein [Aliarcobacter butzleri]|uniref:ParB/RepB/Spo0J family partition protein n=1 Tax=Aliarcobacter butzleri TaxID=28197 RepID=UPI002B241479|nr:ParB N-terminal domain-containing protein [Aliarcobacter butzleri]
MSDIEKIKEKIEELLSLKKKTPKDNNEIKRLRKELSTLENGNGNISISKSLFSESKKQEPKYLNIFEIKDNPFQPRVIIDEDEINDLAESIKNRRLLQPISVAIFQGQLYLNVGQKRLKAYKKLYEEEKTNNPNIEDFESKYLKIYSITIEVSSLEELSDMALTENLARTNPFVIDTSLAIKKNFEIQKELWKSLASNKNKSLNELKQYQEMIKDMELSEEKEEILQSDYTKMAQKKFGIKSKGTISKYLTIATLDDELINLVREYRFNSFSKLYYIAKSNISIDEKKQLLKSANNDEMSLKDFETLSYKESNKEQDNNKDDSKQEKEYKEKDLTTKNISKDKFEKKEINLGIGDLSEYLNISEEELSNENDKKIELMLIGLKVILKNK